MPYITPSLAATASLGVTDTGARSAACVVCALRPHAPAATAPARTKLDQAVIGLIART